MKRLILSNQIVFGMKDITPKKSGLLVHIWSEHCGVTRNKPDSIPRVILSKDGEKVSVSIESNSKILAKSKGIKKADMLYIVEAVKYIGRNYDVFLKHYNDKDDSFDDEDLNAVLRERGELL